MNNYNQDTIAAITTSPGASGINVIRLSGDQSWEITLKLFRTPSKKELENLKSHKVYYGWIIDPKNSSLIDEAIILPFKSPKSYTTEDCIEIQCHGGINVTRKILELCLQNGARMAENGEFTKRAFLGGRIDLTQVEAVLDIISARTELFSSVAAHNLSGKLSLQINELRNTLIQILAQIHASIDFPEEVDEIPYDKLITDITNSINKVNTILNRATDGTILKHGIKSTIIGKPNVGKSSLFNYLLNADRAIVTNIPGTTRDILQEYIDIDGIPVIITDTAGIRKITQSSGADYIESIGVDKSKNAVSDSDLIIFVYDLSQGLRTEDKQVLQEACNYGKPIIIAGNKADLTSLKNAKEADEVYLSTITGSGIPELKDKIRDSILGKNFKREHDEVYINIRHKESLNKALEHLNHAQNAANKMELQDLISIDVKAALLSLDEIVGEVVSEEIIDHIFSQFCIGK